MWPSGATTGQRGNRAASKSAAKVRSIPVGVRLAWSTLHRIEKVCRRSKCFEHARRLDPASLPIRTDLASTFTTAARNEDARRELQNISPWTQIFRSPIFGGDAF